MKETIEYRSGISFKVNVTENNGKKNIFFTT